LTKSRGPLMTEGALISPKVRREGKGEKRGGGGGGGGLLSSLLETKESRKIGDIEEILVVQRNSKPQRIIRQEKSGFQGHSSWKGSAQ